MSLYAQCRVYVGQDGFGPPISSVTWVEVTDWVRSVTTSRGRSNEFDAFQAGTATIVFDNRTSVFTPSNVSSPVYPGVSVRTAVKIEAEYASVTYPVYQGFVVDWDFTFPAVGRDAVVAARCVDMLAMLAQIDLPDTAHEGVLRLLQPVAWWRLGDETNTMKDSAGSRDGSYTGDRERVDGLTLPSESSGASRLNAPAGTLSASIATGAFTTTPSTTAFTVSAVVQFNPASGSNAGIVRFSDGGSGGFTLSAANGVFTVSVTQASPLINTQLRGGSAAGTHHVAVTRSGATLTLYVDGVSVASSGAHGTASVGYVACYVGDTVGSADVTIDELAIWDTALASGQIVNLSLSARGFAGDMPETRIDSVYAILQYPSVMTDIDAGSMALGVMRGGTNVADYLQRVARSDLGRLYATRDGKIAYRGKQADVGATASVEFGSLGTPTSSVRFVGVGASLNESLTYNRVTVTASDAAYTYDEVSTQSTFGVKSIGWDTELPTANACRDIAERIAANHLYASTRLKAWTVYPQRPLNGSATLGYAKTLGLELGDVVSVNNPDGSSYTLSLSSIGHTIDLHTGVWSVVFAGTPAITTQYFAWGVSQWGGSDGWG